MNRWLGWMIAGAALLAGCSVPDLEALGPFTCEDSSACAPGFTCAAGRCVRPGEVPVGPGPGNVDGGADGGGVQPGGEDGGGTQPGGTDGGTDGGTQPADTTPPTLEVFVPTLPSTPGASGSTSYAELGSDGKALPAAWLRDQEVSVELRTDTSLPLSFRVTGTDNVAVTMPVTPFTSGCSAPQCARAAVRMWQPRLDAMRGALSYEITARDEAGNTTTRTGTFPVTRWKWSYTVFAASNLDNSIEATPGIGELGTVYFGTYYTDLMALAPDGKALWPSFLRGEGAPVVGMLEDGREIIFVRNYWQEDSGNRGHMLYAYDPATRALLGSCPSTQVNELWIDSYALTSLGKFNSGVVAPAHSQPLASLLLLRGGASSSSPCQRLSTSFWPSSRGNAVVRGDALFYSDGNNNITSVTPGSSSQRSGWPVPPRRGGGFNGLAVLGDQLVMGEGTNKSGELGGISTTSLDSGKDAVLRYAGGSIAMPTVGYGGVGYGVDRQSLRLVRIASLLASASRVIQSPEAGFTALNAPTLGQGGLLYAMRGGELGVLSAADLSTQWKWTPYGYPSGGRAEAPTIDCTRDAKGNIIPGRPGVLYAPIHNKVHAIIVDSAGLDADAPWPKFQHDGRNSGNPDIPILRCP